MSEFLRVDDLVKSYPSGNSRLVILENLNLSLGQGRRIAIVGASGCGKSTLLQLVGGMDQPDSGSIEIDGTDLAAMDVTALARYRNREIGFVFQFHHLLPEFSAVENVMMPLLMRGRPRPEAMELADGLLSELGLSQRLQHRPGELSGGEQQRVALARALVGRPRLLLADEPSGNLDAVTSGQIHELLVEVHEGFQLTTVIVTHDEHLSSLCHEVWRLEFGRLERVV